MSGRTRIVPRTSDSTARMTGAGLMVVATVCLAALAAVISTAVRFAMTGELDPSAVAWSTGNVGVAAALLARTWQAQEPAGTRPTP